MAKDLVYQVFKINKLTKEIQETFEFLSVSEFKKKYPRYYYSEFCLHIPNYLEIISEISECEQVMIQINSAIGDLND